MHIGTLFITSSIVYFIKLEVQIKAGELTEEGINSAYIKAREFKNKYYGLLPDDDEAVDKMLIQTLIKTFCSRKRRNVVSLFMRLKGLFPEMAEFKNIDISNLNATQFLADNFKTEFPSDLMFNVLENTQCRKIIDEKVSQTKDIYSIHEFAQKLTGMYIEIFGDYFKSLPETMHTYIKIFYVADYLERHIENGIEFTDQEIKLKELLTSYYKLIVDTTADEPSLNRLFTSRIYAEILNSYEEKIQGSERVMIMFSAHDVTMSAFIHSLNADVKEFNYDFNDEINFVLYELEEEYFVSVKYNNEELKLPFCEGKKICEYEKFKQFVQEYAAEKENLENFCDGKLKTLTNNEEDFKKEEF